MGRSDTMSKSSFFAALQGLEDSDDDQDEEVLTFQKILSASRPSKNISYETAKAAPSIPEPPSLIRANTVPQPASSKDAKKLDEKQADVRKFQSEPKVRTVQRSYTTGTMPGIASKGSSKRKADALKPIPEAQKIFKDLVFCMLDQEPFLGKVAINTGFSLRSE